MPCLLGCGHHEQISHKSLSPILFADDGWQARLLERAMVTPLVVHRKRKYPFSQHLTDRHNRLLDTVPQALVEDHFPSSPGAVVIDRSARNRFASHFFETDRLGAELEIVVIPLTSMPRLVFDRIGSLFVKFHYIGFPD